MVIFQKINKQINTVSDILNWLAAASVVVMMLLTCLDVVLRFFRHPIPGTYEMVGFTGAILISFSLAHTSLRRGHIAVDFFVSKCSPLIQRIIDQVNSVICSTLFGLISWQSVVYAFETKNAGEVSMTLQMPIYPFILGIATGCGILSIVLALRFILSFVPEEKKER